MRYILSAMLISTLFFTVIKISSISDNTASPSIFEYVIANFQAETGSGNPVAAIILNYRMYDTLFEALILLVAIMGMKHFLPGLTELEEYKQKPDSSPKKRSGI